MIPADSFLLSDDGTTALVVFGGVPGWTPIGWEADNRPCVVCKGLGRDIADLVTPCPDCDGTGRHTFTIEVECTGKLVEVTDNGRFGLSCDGGCGKEYPWGTLTFTVHVLDVLPIVNEAGSKGIPGRVITHNVMTGLGGTVVRTWLWDGLEAREPITLPPAAQPGQWLVRLAVHS